MNITPIGIDTSSGQARLPSGTDVVDLNVQGGSITKTLVNTVATGLFEVALAASTTCGGMIFLNVTSSAVADFQSVTTIITYTAVNTAGTISSQISAGGTQTYVTALTALAGTTLTGTSSITAGASKITINVLATSTSTTPTITAKYQIFTERNQVITLV